MPRIALRSCLTAGSLAMLLGGCRHDYGAREYVGSESEPVVHRWSAPALAGGLVPASYRVREAESVDVPATETNRRPRPAATVEAVVFERASNYQPRPAPPQPSPLVSACAPDHHWLMGWLQHDPVYDRWSVRYSKPGDQDLYGGVLELIRTGPMEGFRSGQFVRVEGELVDPAPHEIKPAYRVRSLQVLRR